LAKLVHQQRVQITSAARLNLIKVLPRGCKKSKKNLSGL
jgi:hypothetical protein